MDFTATPGRKMGAEKLDARNISAPHFSVYSEMEISTASNLTVGPKISDTLAKYKRDAKAILREIIEPSRNIMPVALLNTFDKDQILDLLAFVLADGKADNVAFKQESSPKN